MTPARWQQVEDLFHKALDVPARDRDAWLERETSGDIQLFRMVREMIDADTGDDSSGQIADMIGGAANLVVNEQDRPPARLGPYEVLSELGSGGMGKVYLATRADDHFKKQVAIKVVRAGLADPVSHERFLQERQILASLDHPYIARLLDGGATPDGLPYLILDYVEGRRITEYCATLKLTVTERCRLFIKVCEAVAYAHQNLIVHRDLKPANILVTADGTPKLLDFGIAKLLSQDGAKDITRAVYGLMTPQYASPEQVKGAPVTTATDVYSLGAILYELLAGSTPHKFDTQSPSELIRVVCEQHVPPPSKSAPDRIPRDLDNIVLKAMEKDPRRRYSSAEQLGDDILRHLERQPVLARGNSTLYRLGRFCQRQWMPLAAGLAVIATLSGAVVQSRRQALIADELRQVAVRERDRAEAERLRAERSAREAVNQRAAALSSSREATSQRERADKRFDQLRNLIQRFLFDIDTAVADLPGTSNARRVLAKTSLQYLDSMSREAGQSPGLQRDLAAAYERVGELQGSPTKPSLGDTAGAIASYRKALTIRKQLPLDSLTSRIEMMNLYNNMNVVLRDLGQSQEAIRVLEDGLKLRQPPYSDDPLMLLEAAHLHFQRGSLSEQTTDVKVAIEDFRRAQELNEKVAALQPANQKALDGVAQSHYQIGRALCRMGDYAKGLPDLRKGIEGFEALTKLEPSSVQYPRLLAIIMRAYANNVGERDSGSFRNLDESLDYMRRAMQINKTLYDKDPSNRVAWYDYIRSIGSVARVHSLRDEWEPSARLFGQGRTLMEQLRSQNPLDTKMADDLGYFTMEFAMSNYYLKNYDAAVDMINRGKTIYEGLLAAGSKSRFHRFNLGLAIRKLGEIDAIRGQKEEGRRKIQQALDVFEDLTRIDPAMKMFSYQRDETIKTLDKLK